jgi:Transposase IS66 family
MISRLPQGFGTRCLRFARGVAAARARLASGWLVGLCRERVELSGSRRKVSERSHVILLSRAYPVASWVHAERLVHQLIPATRGQAQAIETTRQLIWWFYRDLKVWKTDPCPRRARALRARFDRIFTRRTGFVMLDRLLARLHRRKAELLRVLERPEIPLHTNASENDIRACVTKRKISGGTMSAAGRNARDVMLGLMKTCRKLGVSFFVYLGDRLSLNTGGSAIPPLACLVTAPA